MREKNVLVDVKLMYRILNELMIKVKFSKMKIVKITDSEALCPKKGHQLG